MPDMNAELPRTTRAEELRAALADEIVSGRLTPGYKLEERELAERFGVSRTPVREALRQLAAAGLAETRPHKGVVVAPVTEKRLHDMFEMMAELEGVCARLAAVRMSAPERRDLEGKHEACARFMRSGSAEEYHIANETFHGAIYVGSHNGFLADNAFATRSRLAPFRRAQFRVMGRLAKSVAEHDAVVQSILRGDGDGAARLMRHHVSLVGDASADYVASHRSDGQVVELRR